MKNKITTFIIGMLVGAIIATGGFFIYQKINHPKGMQGDRPNRMMERRDGETPPEKPDGEQGEPPDKKDRKNTTSNTSDETTSDKTSNESGGNI